MRSLFIGTARSDKKHSLVTLGLKGWVGVVVVHLLSTTTVPNSYGSCALEGAACFVGGFAGGFLKAWVVIQEGPWGPGLLLVLALLHSLRPLVTS